MENRKWWLIDHIDKATKHTLTKPISENTKRNWVTLYFLQCSGLWYLSFVQIALSWSVRNPDVWWWSISQNSFSIFLHLYSIEMASYRSCFVCKYLLYSTTTNHDAIRLSKLGQSEPITQLLFLFTYLREEESNGLWW